MNKNKLLFIYFLVIISMCIYFGVFTDVDFILVIFFFILFPFTIMFGRKQINLKKNMGNKIIKKERNILFIYSLLAVFCLIIISVIKLFLMNSNKIE